MTKKRISRRAAGFFIFSCALIFLSALPVLAKPNSLLATPTSNAEIFMLFSKMTGEPGLGAAIQKTPDYQKADPDQRKVIVADAESKAPAYSRIDPKNNIVVIRSAVTIRADITKYPGLKISLPGYETPQKGAGAIYFPYNYLGKDIALIPDKINTFLDIPMDVKEASDAASRIKNYSATLVLEMRPLVADGQYPQKLDRVTQWLMMTQIVGVTFYNQYLQVIWDWKDPSYNRDTGISPLQQLKK